MRHGYDDKEPLLQKDVHVLHIYISPYCVLRFSGLQYITWYKYTCFSNGRQGPFYWDGLTAVQAWISNYIH